MQSSVRPNDQISHQPITLQPKFQLTSQVGRMKEGAPELRLYVASSIYSETELEVW